MVRRVAGLGLLLVFSVVAAGAQEARPRRPSPAELIERERVRAAMERAYETMEAPSLGRGHSHDKLAAATRQVLEVGPAALPFLEPELESLDPRRFSFVAYALGRLGVPEAHEALRRSMATADGQGGEQNRRRKAWCGFALGLLGVPEAVDLLDTGQTPAARTEVARQLTALEATALMTAPQSVPLLVQQLERYKNDERQGPRRVFTLNALERIGDSSVLPKVAPLTEDDDVSVRIAALSLLGALEGDEVAPRLIAAIDDPLLSIRKQAVRSIAEVRPPEATKALLARLELEDDPILRGEIYDYLAETLGDAAIPLLAGNWGAPSIYERMAVIRAAGSIRDPKALNLLRLGLRDRENNVRNQAIRALERFGSAAATNSLLAALRDPDETFRLAVADSLTDRLEARAAPRIASLLLQEVIPKYSVERGSRQQLKELTLALVTLRYVAPLDDLRKAIGRISDPAGAAALTGAVKLLATLDSLGDDVDKWIATLDDPDPSLRALASDRLVEIGKRKAMDALSAAFDKLDDPQRMALLDSAARHAQRGAAPLVERVLEAEEYDLLGRLPLRDAAAWAARRIGGPQMERALKTSALRRDGQDYKVLAYYAVLAGPRALPVLRQVRSPRVRYPRWDRGLEQRRLEWMIRRLEHGLDLAAVDGPPLEIDFGV